MEFEQFYITWYARTKHFVNEYVRSEADAENIVQDVFLDLFEKKVLFNDQINLVAYLFTSMKNKCMDHLRHKVLEQEAVCKMQEEFDLSLRLRFDSLEAFDTNLFKENDMETLISRALSTLPERCRIIFVKNKLEGKKQKEIAAELQISVNTVESQMAIAYIKLREALKDCLPLLIFFL